MAYNKETCHFIWSNYHLNYEDWRDDLEEEYPDLTEEGRVNLMYKMNDDDLDEVRANLNIQLGHTILVIGDLGLWDGRRSGYKEIESGNIRDCLFAGRDDDYCTWYVDEEGDLRCDAVHHDGTNYYTYRVYKESLTDDQIEELHTKICAGKATPEDIAQATLSVGDNVAKVYGW